MANNLQIKAFDPNKEIHLYTDAVQIRGLGFVLLQPTGNQAKPYNLIQAGSTHLTDTQSRYSTYQIKLLALVYALEKTRHYCLGSPSPIQIYTDHLSLRAIENKDLDNVNSS